MTTYTRGQFRVYTFKEGLLSSVAHDLRLSLERFEVIRDGGQVRGCFWGESLVVDGVVREGKLQREALNFMERRQIRKTLRKEVLRTHIYPVARFLGTLSENQIEGELTLNDTQKTICFEVEDGQGKVAGQVELEPSRWGITPYSALLGAIRLQDRVKIEFCVEAEP